MLLAAAPTDNSFRLTILAESAEVSIPAEVGVAADDSTQALFTVDEGGEVYMDSLAGQELGDFFEIWRNHAGTAGDNPDASFSSQQLMESVAADGKTVQMFVNGHVSKEFEQYAVQDGDEIVLVYGDNTVVSLNTNFGPIVTELFESETPGTVANFLNYVNDGDYVNSIFHRSVPEFVIQGGGFTTDSEFFADVSQFTSVPADPPIENEPGISNVRGTIAMAKYSGDPDSATSQFFINLADNSANLDNQNGGFTVFGQVLDMSTVDVLENLSINRFNSSPFNEFPYRGVVDAGRFLTQLVVIQDITGQGEISGTTYLDENANGTYESGEELLAGVVVYVDANDDGLRDADETWVESDADGSYRLQVEAGTHTVRHEATAGRVTTEPSASDSYQVTVEIGRETSGVRFGEADLSPPTGVSLLASADTGVADDDLLTQKNNSDPDTALSFEVIGVTAGVDLQILADDTPIGSALPTEATVTVTSDGDHTLVDGVHAITAVQVLGGTTTESAPLEITVDTTSPDGVTDPPPDTARVGELYAFDAECPEEGQVFYSLENAPDGMAIDTLTGEVTWTPSESQAGSLSYDLVVTDAAGNTTSQAVSVTLLPEVEAVDLGLVDFTRLSSVATGNEDQWWRLETAHEGWLSVQPSEGPAASPLTLELYRSTDSAQPLVQSETSDGTPRIDWTVESGETYLLRAVGLEPDTKLLLANLVQEDGDAVTVHGTAAEDVFVFDARNSREIAINGISYHYEDAAVTSVTFDGGEGRDVAWMFDSAGDETVEAWPDRASLVNDADDGVPDYVVTAVGIEDLLAYATGGGNDSAVFHGAEGADKLKSYEHSVRLRDWKSAYTLRAKSFDTVAGDSGTGGKDVAVFNGSNGDEVFTYAGSDNSARVEGSQRDHLATGFDAVVARAGGGGADLARFTGIPGVKDIVYFKSHKTQLLSADIEVMVRAFDEIHATANENDPDVARMYDTPGDEHLEIEGEIARLYRREGEEIDLFYEAADFEILKAYSTEGDDSMEAGDSGMWLLLYGWDE